MDVIKRVAVALLITMGLTVGFSPAAHADKPVCYTVPDLPGECVSEATYTYLVALQADRDQWRQAWADTNAEREDYRLALWERNDQLRAAHVEAAVLQSQVDEAYDWIDFLNHRRAVLRAKIRHLWQVIDTLT